MSHCEALFFFPAHPALTLTVTVPVRFTLAWHGLDNAAGVRDYEVEYSSGGPWLAWLNGITTTHTSFLGESGASYTFRIRATDNVSNVGDWLEVGPVQISSVTKYYTHGGTRVAMRQGDVVYYLHGDHLGSTSLTTDSSGNVVSEVRYLPYGEERWANGETPTDFGFTSQRREGFGLYDYNARYYSPTLGRFISPDTIVPEPGSSGGFNRYRYTRNNPLRYTDPSGHCPGCGDGSNPVMLRERVAEDAALTANISTVYHGPPDPRTTLEKIGDVIQIAMMPFAVAGGLESTVLFGLEVAFEAEMSQLPPNIQVGAVVPGGGPSSFRGVNRAGFNFTTSLDPNSARITKRQQWIAENVRNYTIDERLGFSIEYLSHQMV